MIYGIIFNNSFLYLTHLKSDIIVRSLNDITHC